MREVLRRNRKIASQNLTHLSLESGQSLNCTERRTLVNNTSALVNQTCDCPRRVYVYTFACYNSFIYLPVELRNKLKKKEQKKDAIRDQG